MRAGAGAKREAGSCMFLLSVFASAVAASITNKEARWAVGVGKTFQTTVKCNAESMLVGVNIAPTAQLSSSWTPSLPDVAALHEKFRSFVCDSALH